MLSKSFKPAKCKTSLKLAVARIKLLRNKREVQVKQMKRELAQLLESGQEQTARIRVEHVIREEKTMSAYELIELYCELLVARLPIIESQKGCPIDLKEAVSSVVFASPRCADVPELMDIRKHLTAKYGKEFINSALEVRPDCGVSRLVVEKLSARAPDIGTKVKMLTSIAQEHNVKWDPKAFEEELQKPHDDLLNGPTAFVSASNMPCVKSSSAPNQAGESSNMKKMPQNAAATQQTIGSNFSETNTRPGVSMPFTSQSESRPSERRSGEREVNNSYAREENVSLNWSAWKMEFPDATSAAQAAAESAERASMAARAAAELASRESMSSQNSSGSNESTTYTTKYDRPEKLRGYLDEHVTDDSVRTIPKGNDSIKSSKEEGTKVQILQQDERMQGTSERATASTPNNDRSTESKAPIQFSSYSSQGYVDDEIFDANLHKNDMKDHGRVQRISSKSKAVDQNHQNMRYENVASHGGNTNVNPSKAYSSNHVTDDETFWNSSIIKHENDRGDTSRMGPGEVSLGNTDKQSTSNDHFDIVFDNYGSDAEDNSSVFGRNKGNLLDTYQEEEPSRFQSTKDSLRVDRSGSFVKNKDSQLHLFTESQPEEHHEAMTRHMSPSKDTDSAPPAFDASDGEGADSEDEVVNSTHNEAKRASTILHDQRHSTNNSYSDESFHESKHIYMDARKEVEESISNSGVYEDNTETDGRAAASKISDLSSTHRSQQSPGSTKAPSNSNISVGGPVYSSSDEEEPWQPSQLTRRQPSRERETKETSMRLNSGSSEVLNDRSDESVPGINFGRLSGGFKHRGFPRPPYVRSSAADHASSLNHASDSAPVTEKQIVPDLDMQPVNFEVRDQERYNEASQPKAYATKPRTSRGSADSHSGTADELAVHNTGKRQFVSNKAKIAEDEEFIAQEPYHQISRKKGYKKGSSDLQGSSDNPDSYSQSHYAVDSRDFRDSASTQQNLGVPLGIDSPTAFLANKAYTSSEVGHLESDDQKPRMMTYKDSNATYLDSDSSKAKSESTRTGGSRVKLSWRTRDVPLESKDRSSRVDEPLPGTSYDASAVQAKRSAMPIQPDPSVEKLSVAPKQTPLPPEESLKSKPASVDNLVPTNDGNARSSSLAGESVSRESSLKKDSHTHPKLPDYESFAAHFHSLRSNRR